MCKQYSLEAGAHNLLRLDQRASVKSAGKLSPVHKVSKGNAKYHFTVTNLSSVHKVSKGNAGESLCALGSHIHEGCAAYAKSGNKETAKKQTR